MKENRIADLLFIGILLLVTPLQGQEKLVDSLKARLQEDLSAHQRVMTQNDLAYTYSWQDLERGKALNKRTIAEAESQEDYRALTLGWSHRVYFLIKSNELHEVKSALEKVLDYSQKADTLSKGIAYYMAGYFNYSNDHPEEALKNWHRALAYLTAAEDTYYTAGIYNLLYGIYAEKAQDEKATQYARLTLKYARKGRDKDNLAAGWQINGSDYLDRFERTKDTVLLDSAVYAYRQSLLTYKRYHPIMRSFSGVPLAALNLANIQMDYYPQSSTTSIVDYIDLAFTISRKTHNFSMQMNAYQMRSKFNWLQGDHKASEEALQAALPLIDSMDSKEDITVMNLFQSLATVNENMGKEAVALQYYKQYFDYYRKAYNAQQDRVIKTLEAKYEAERKDKKLQLLEQHNRYQRKQLTLYTLIGIIAVIGLFLLFLVYRFRLKYALQREKSVAEERARLEAEHKLVRHQKKQMQKELMVGALQIEHKNEILQNLKERLKENQSDGAPSVRSLSQMINEEMRIDNDFEQIKTEIKNIHPHFFQSLQEKAQGKLTDLDLKYCAYIYMNLDSKQIATLLNITPKSVRMAKYRLKRKIGLDKEIQLTEWIKSLHQNF